MSSILASNGMVFATAMAAVSGTVLLLALRLQKPPSILHHPRSCISPDGKKREKKNKKVHFAEDVMEPSGNGEEFRRRLQSKNVNLGHNPSTLKDQGCKGGRSGRHGRRGAGNFGGKHRRRSSGFGESMERNLLLAAG